MKLIYNFSHNNGTTQWEDPRDLPDGWEKVSDGVYGTFYVELVFICCSGL